MVSKISFWIFLLSFINVVALCDALEKVELQLVVHYVVVSVDCHGCINLHSRQLVCSLSYLREGC